MNIFACDPDPCAAVLFILWWRHIVKMPLEAVQILYAAHHVRGGLPADAPANAYKKTHANHPCVKWAAASTANYLWLVEHAAALCRHYTAYLRQQLTLDLQNNVPASRRHVVRDHACMSHIGWLRNHVPACPGTEPTPFEVVIAEDELERVGVYVNGNLDVHETYKNYVREDVAIERAARRKVAETKKRKRAPAAVPRSVQAKK